MTKIRIDYDVRYPDFLISTNENSGKEVEIPDDKISWIKRVHMEYAQVSNYLFDLLDWGGKERRKEESEHES